MEGGLGGEQVAGPGSSAGSTGEEREEGAGPPPAAGPRSPPGARTGPPPRRGAHRGLSGPAEGRAGSGGVGSAPGAAASPPK